MKSSIVGIDVIKKYGKIKPADENYKYSTTIADLDNFLYSLVENYVNYDFYGLVVGYQEDGAFKVVEGMDKLVNATLFIKALDELDVEDGQFDLGYLAWPYYSKNVNTEPYLDINNHDDRIALYYALKMGSEFHDFDDVNSNIYPNYRHLVEKLHTCYNNIQYMISRAINDMKLMVIELDANEKDRWQSYKRTLNIKE